MNDALRHPHPSDSSVSRRTVAQGLAWSVPAVAAVAAAPSYAASSPVTVTGSVCQLFYGGGTVNYQVHSIYLGVTSSTGIIPEGTVLTWTVDVGADPSGRHSVVPTTNYSADNKWSLALSPSAGGTNIGRLTVTLTFHQDYVYSGTWCAPAIIWTDSIVAGSSRALMPQAPITVTSNGVTSGPGNVTSGGTGTLAYTAPKRHPQGINQTGRAPHIYRSKSGVQSCYPEVQFSRVNSNDGVDNVATWPAGVTPPGERSTWGGSTARADANGQSSPVFRQTARSGQYNHAAVC
ncbi:MAG: hypothetical protein Q4G34_00440 [Micrococcus sp.]|nr:hypothetical protein [Micrococcus sp.]